MANVVIKHAKRSECLASRGWTHRPSEAIEFASSLQALDYCWQHRLREVVIVIQFRDPRFNIELHPFAERTVRFRLEGASRFD